MSNKLIIAIAVALVVVVAAVGVYFVMGNDKGDPNDVTFLIQDSDGVYFWLEGNGETVQDALVDAFESYPSETITFSNSGSVKLFDIGTINNGDGTYTYWIQFTWKDNKWTYNQLSMKNINSADVEYILVLHGTTVSMELAVAPEGTPTPADVVIWNGSTGGTVFTIASASGLYFKINGNSSESLIKAFNAACAKYKVPLVNTESEEYGQGVDTLFGFGWDEESGLFWSQYEVVSGAWSASSQGMSSLKCGDYPIYLVCYSLYGATPDIPV